MPPPAEPGKCRGGPLADTLAPRLTPRSHACSRVAAAGLAARSVDPVWFGSILPQPLATVTDA